MTCSALEKGNEVDKVRDKRHGCYQIGLLVWISAVDSFFQLNSSVKVRKRVLYLYCSQKNRNLHVELVCLRHRDDSLTSRRRKWSVTQSCSYVQYLSKHSLRNCTSYLETITATTSLKFVSIDILGQLKEPKDGITICLSSRTVSTIR